MTATRRDSQFGRISRDPGDLRGRQGGQIRLVRVSAPFGRPRPQGRPAGYFRRLQGPCRERRGFPAGGALPTLHGTFLPQRLQPRPFDQGSRGQPHARNALAHASKNGRRVVSAFVATAFAQHTPAAARKQWRHVADQLPKLAALLDEAEVNVLAFMDFPKAHWAKICSTNPIERRDQAPHRRDRHIPQRRRHNPARRRYPDGAKRRVGGATRPLHDAGNHRPNQR